MALATRMGSGTVSSCPRALMSMCSKMSLSEGGEAIGSKVCFKRLRAMSVDTCAWCGKVESKLRYKQHHPKWRRVGDLVTLDVGGGRHHPAGCAEATGRWCIADNWWGGADEMVIGRAREIYRFAPDGRDSAA